jgi:quercetin dioxygenase-like cupin family protein
MNAVCRRDVNMVLWARAGPATTTQASPLPQPEKSRTLSDSQVLYTDRTPATLSGNGGKRWNVVQGVLPTGEAIAVHESLQPAGVTPNPPHTVQHSELVLVQEGTLLLEYGGRSEKIGPAGVIFVAIGTRHAARNVGDASAKYLVIAIGGDTGQIIPALGCAGQEIWRGKA